MITVKNLTKKYNKTTALDNVQFLFKDKKVTAIMGENGAGKSTLLKICAGILPFDYGTIIVDNYSISKHSIEVRKSIGYLPEMPFLYDRLTGREFLLYICSLRKIDFAEKKINQFSKTLEINRFLDNELGGYSKGMKQKISLISAIIHQPANLLLDEPVWGLDPLTNRTLRNFIADRQATTVIATHSPQLVEDVADMVYFLSNGCIISSNDVSFYLNEFGSIEESYFHKVRALDA